MKLEIKKMKTRLLQPRRNQFGQWTFKLCCCVENPTLVLFITQLNCKFITSFRLTWVQRMDIATFGMKVKEI